MVFESVNHAIPVSERMFPFNLHVRADVCRKSFYGTWGGSEIHDPNMFRSMTGIHATFISTALGL